MLLPGACWPIRALSLLLEYHCVARSCPLDCYRYNHLRYEQKHSEKWTCHINLSWGCQHNNSVTVMYIHCALTCSRLCANDLTSVTSFDPHNDPLETVIIESDGWRTDPKGLPVIPHKGNGGVGSSDSDRLEFKAFALCCNSILPLYAKHTHTKKTEKGLNEGSFYRFIRTKERGHDERNSFEVLVLSVSRRDRYSGPIIS